MVRANIDKAGSQFPNVCMAIQYTSENRKRKQKSSWFLKGRKPHIGTKTRLSLLNCHPEIQTTTTQLAGLHCDDGTCEGNLHLKCDP